MVVFCPAVRTVEDALDGREIVGVRPEVVGVLANARRSTSIDGRVCDDRVADVRIGPPFLEVRAIEAAAVWRASVEVFIPPARVGVMEAACWVPSPRFSCARPGRYVARVCPPFSRKSRGPCVRGFSASRNVTRRTSILDASEIMVASGPLMMTVLLSPMMVGLMTVELL